MIETLESKTIALATMKRTNEKEMYIFLLFAINNLVEFTGGKLTENVLKETAEIFYSKAYYLNLDDIKLFINMCKGYEYGQPYGNISGAILISWLDKFLDHRMSRAERENQFRNLQFKRGERKDGYEILSPIKNYVK